MAEIQPAPVPPTVFDPSKVKSQIPSEYPNGYCPKYCA
jgi:hypothetical protein